ncbi:SMP-30/gluconolactonase/LRE family protein [Microbacterium sp. 1P10UB]|uniref:SMP-30/gluconolactonase/LRE family protein n=1 Tax=unclassified Microbacterium TaxID=2609290 RepID=UPI0039A1E136
MKRAAEVMLTGLEAPEGPVCLAPGDVVFAEQIAGQVTRFTADGPAIVARGAGSFNALALGSDGLLYAAQNGGVVDEWRSATPAAPSVQRVSLDGRVETLATAANGLTLRAPNDLAFGPDGALYVTDPAEPFDAENARATARVYAFDANGGRAVITAESTYTNGIAFLGDGRLCWIESYARLIRVREEDGHARTLATLPERQTPDGMAVAEDGRLFVASVTSGEIAVLGPDGELFEVIPLDDRANPTNLCFDGSALWVTDMGADHTPGAGDGRLWRVETDATGLALHRGSLA